MTAAAAWTRGGAVVLLTLFVSVSAWAQDEPGKKEKKAPTPEAKEETPTERKEAKKLEIGKGEEKTESRDEEAEKGKKEKEARDEEKAEEEVEEIVVTATRTPRTVKSVPASVSVITSEDISKRHIKNIDEALKHCVGVYDRRGKGMTDTLSRVTLRGFGYQHQTLILLDGKPINSGYSEGVPWSGIPIENVERIEVVRGPNSALYGGQAMGGVINIITKKPMKRQVKLKGGYGTYDTWTKHFSYGDRFLDKVSVLFSYDRKATGGYPSGLVTRSPSSPGTGTSVYGTDAPGRANITGFGYTLDSQGKPKYVVGDTGNNWWDEETMSSPLI